MMLAVSLHEPLPAPPHNSRCSVPPPMTTRDFFPRWMRFIRQLPARYSVGGFLFSQLSRVEARRKGKRYTQKMNHERRCPLRTEILPVPTSRMTIKVARRSFKISGLQPTTGGSTFPVGLGCAGSPGSPSFMEYSTLFNISNASSNP